MKRTKEYFMETRMKDYDTWKQTLPEEQPKHECDVCGKPIDHEGLCGSKACLKADML